MEIRTKNSGKAIMPELQHGGEPAREIENRLSPAFQILLGLVRELEKKGANGTDFGEGGGKG